VSGRPAEVIVMTIAPPRSAFAAVPGTDDVAVADVTTLLPAREAVLARLAEQLPSTDDAPATLLVVGLLRRDDGWPTPQSTLAQVTMLLARSLRGDDWLASSGPAEFVIVMSGSTPGAQAAAERLVAGVAGLGIPGLSAAAGLARLTTGLSAGEALRRATVSRTAARRVGAGTVVTHQLPD
jgi:GGDEF domain-containing protein